MTNKRKEPGRRRAERLALGKPHIYWGGRVPGWLVTNRGDPYDCDEAISFCLIELLGGPYDGQRVWLNTPGTLPIRVRGWYGRYDAEGRWQNL